MGGPSGRTGLRVTLLILIVAVALSVSFVCSVLEAALLSARQPDLMARRDAGERGAALLLDLRQHRLEDSISAILILNTIAHTIGAAMSGAQAAVVFGDRWVGVFSGVLTLLILLGTEIIPKTLGTTYAKALAGPVARVLVVLIVLMGPFLVMTRLFTRLISHKGSHGISRSEIAALVAAARSQGTLPEHESALLKNALRLDIVKVSDVMTPRTVTAMLPAATTVREFLTSAKAAPFSRVPIFGESEDDADRYVLQREVLRHAAEGDLDRPLAELARDLPLIQETEALGAAMRKLIAKGEHMAIVGDEFGAVAGIVTLEDGIETLLGVEIVDESDRFVDLRERAVRLRDERLERRRGAAEGGPRGKHGPSGSSND